MRHDRILEQTSQPSDCILPEVAIEYESINSARYQMDAGVDLFAGQAVAKDDVDSGDWMGDALQCGRRRQPSMVKARWSARRVRRCIAWPRGRRLTIICRLSAPAFDANHRRSF